MFRLGQLVLKCHPKLGFGNILPSSSFTLRSMGGSFQNFHNQPIREGPPPPFSLPFLFQSQGIGEISFPQSRIIRMPPSIKIPSLPSLPNTPTSINSEILDLPILNRIIEDAPNPNQVKKEAARMIVIRRIKMNKHKLKKLRRRMRIVWAKIRLRRATWREKIYLNEKMVQVKAAWKFDAKTHVEQLIRNVRDRHVQEPWIHPKMPDSVIKEQMKIRAEKKKRKFLSILDRRPPLT